MNQSPAIFRLARARGARSGFTLVELIIVILIISVLAGLLFIGLFAVLGESKVKATEVTLQTINGAMVTLVDENKRREWINDLGWVKGRVNADFAAKTGIDKAKTWKDLNTMQRAKLLAFLLAPSEDQWGKIVPKTSNLPKKPLIDEQNAKDFLAADSDGFNYIKDRWEHPITFEFLEGQAGVANAAPRWVLVSGGEDGKLDADDDNIFYSSAANDIGKGKWKK